MWKRKLWLLRLSWGFWVPRAFLYCLVENGNLFPEKSFRIAWCAFSMCSQNDSRTGCKSICSFSVNSILKIEKDAFFWRRKVDILQAYWSKENLLKLRAGSSDLSRFSKVHFKRITLHCTRCHEILSYPESSSFILCQNHIFFQSSIGFIESLFHLDIFHLLFLLFRPFYWTHLSE